MLRRIEEIASRINLCESTVRTYLHRFNIQTKRKGKYTYWDISIKQINEIKQFLHKIQRI